MRVCLLHWERAVDTLVSKKEGTEYDLCPKCVEKLAILMTETPQKEVKGESKRPDKRRKENK